MCHNILLEHRGGISYFRYEEHQNLPRVNNVMPSVGVGVGVLVCSSVERPAMTVPFHAVLRGIPQPTIPYHAIPLPYHTIPLPYHTIPYHIISYHTIPYHTIPYRTIPYNTIPHHTTSHHTTPYHTIPYHTIPVSYTHLTLPTKA